jgi:hypothetical protein
MHEIEAKEHNFNAYDMSKCGHVLPFDAFFNKWRFCPFCGIKFKISIDIDGLSC